MIIPRRTTMSATFIGLVLVSSLDPTHSFQPALSRRHHQHQSFPSIPIGSSPHRTTTTTPRTLRRHNTLLSASHHPPTTSTSSSSPSPWTRFTQSCTTLATAAVLVLSPTLAHAENELVTKYGGSGIDTTLIDHTCILDQCGAPSQACFADDPDCRKGLTCTVKCVGDNACITGCMARYGNAHLDAWLKCTMEEHSCLDLAVVAPGNDGLGTEAPAPAQTVSSTFVPASMEGVWYKVLGFNPNYDCYACQRNTFGRTSTAGGKNDPQALQMQVEFSMPHLVPDGTAMAMNDYKTNEMMIFDGASSSSPYGRTAHSEGEMFGLKFWENWYILGENDKSSPEEFKFVFYNGKTRQNTYEGAFVYSRTKELSPTSLAKVYQIAQDAGMDPHKFCQIQNQCFLNGPDEQSSMMIINGDEQQPGGGGSTFWRGLLASTRISELLGVEPVAARDTIRSSTARVATTPDTSQQQQRPWWNEIGDYLENPHRHFQAMEKMRVTMEWPPEVIEAANNNRR